jgi:hypothetical protein
MVLQGEERAGKISKKERTYEDSGKTEETWDFPFINLYKMEMIPQKATKEICSLRNIIRGTR